MLHLLLSGRLLWDRNTEKLNKFSLHRAENPRALPSVVMGHFLHAAHRKKEKRKKSACRTHQPPTRVLASQKHESRCNARGCMPFAESPRCRVLRAAGGVCLEVSLETLEPGPSLYQLVSIGDDLLFCPEKVDT